MSALACPSAEELTEQALKLLPRGRAWRSREGGPEPASTLHQFWRSVAEPFAFLHERLCALRREFWCATHVETHDLWMAEYGLPDACDPFPDLCTKVAAIGGTRCEYYAAIAARSGWTIRCSLGCGDEAGCFEAGCGEVGLGVRPGQILVEVFLSESQGYGALIDGGPWCGLMQADDDLACEPDIGPLKCIIERIAHAEIEVLYRVVAGPPGQLDFSNPDNAILGLGLGLA